MQTTSIEEADAPELSDRTIEELSRVFTLLADPPRLRILLRLARTGEMNVTELCEGMQQSQPAVSHHLRLMREAGIIQMRAEGKLHFYSLRLAPFQQLMNVLMHEQGGTNPCDCFLECLLGS